MELKERQLSLNADPTPLMAWYGPIHVRDSVWILAKAERIFENGSQK